MSLFGAILHGTTEIVRDVCGTWDNDNDVCPLSQLNVQDGDGTPTLKFVCKRCDTAGQNMSESVSDA